MNQLELFPKTEQEIISDLKKLKVEIGTLRRGAFAQITDLREDYKFLQDQLEVVMDILIRQGKNE